MMASKRKVSNPLALAVMALLYERPMHPYEMVSLMRERGKHESVRLRYSSLYSVVGALEREGLIVPKETVREGRRPKRTVYEITGAGREESEHELMLREAELGWVRGLAKDIEAGELGSLSEWRSLHAEPDDHRRDGGGWSMI